MKKLTAALCVVLLMICVFVPGAAAAGPALGATRAYCIIDADTGLVLAQQNMNEELHPASITKVMTLGLACEKAQGNWDDIKLTVTHEDVYSLAGTDSSHIALREGEEVPLTDALYATQMASANDGANLLAEYVGEGTIADGVAKMNARVEELGLAHTHFANPHGISDEDHYTSCYDMAQILRWALEQPGFEQVFTRNEMYTMEPTNVQPVTRYFSQQDKMRIGSSRYYISSILGSKLGYTNTARYSYACLAEQNGVRLICVTMQSELSTDKYNDVRTLLDYAFSTFTGYTDLPAQGITAPLSVVGGGGSLGTVTVSDPGVRLLLANGLTADDVEVTLELPESYVIFITRDDILGYGLPIYHIDRQIKELNEAFQDEAHIIYVNSQIKNETKLGRLMHDFSCTNAKDMHNKVLADRVRYFKEDERGVAIMCREMEIMRNQAHEEGVEIGIKKGRMLQLIKQVCAKMQKFSSAEEIANDLVEQDVPLIQKIMDVAPNFGPDYNVDAIYKALNL